MEKIDFPLSSNPNTQDVQDKRFICGEIPRHKKLRKFTVSTIYLALVCFASLSLVITGAPSGTYDTFQLSIGGSSVTIARDGRYLKVAGPAGTSSSIPVNDGKINIGELVDALEAEGFSESEIRAAIPSSITSIQQKTGVTVMGIDAYRRSPLCTCSISKTGQIFNAEKGSGSFSVITVRTCNWNATKNAGWITIISGESGKGNGTVHFTIQANMSHNKRVGLIKVGNKTFTVTQYGA